MKIGKTEHFFKIFNRILKEFILHFLISLYYGNTFQIFTYIFFDAL